MSSILPEVDAQIPELSAWVKFFLKTPAPLRFGMLKPLLSEEGVQQVDSLSPFLFSLAIEGVITKVSNVHGIEFNHWYLDDGVIGESPRAVAHALNTLSVDFRTHNIHLNWSIAEIIGTPSAVQSCSDLCRSSPTINRTGNFQLLKTPIGLLEFMQGFLIREILPRLQAEIKIIAKLPDS
ncbi:hypothetical protein GJ496_001951 [Pomphorhynchus laevis]|nr:hypothetical protein GJ496_001951 [Pomphorhynchus laevis]